MSKSLFDVVTSHGKDRDTWTLAWARGIKVPHQDEFEALPAVKDAETAGGGNLSDLCS